MLRALFSPHRVPFSLLGLAEGHVQRQVISCSCQQIVQNRWTSHQNSQRPPTIFPEMGTGDEDVLTKKIKAVNSLIGIVDVTKVHHSIMNNKQLILSIDTLHRFLRENKDTVSNELNLKDLNPLCGQIVKRARHFSSDECVTILRTLTMLNVSSDSAVVQAVCQMIRHSINELPLKTLTFLDFLLQKHTSTPLIDALRLSIPIVVQAQISTQLDPNSAAEMLSCLSILCKFNPCSPNIEKLCEKLIPMCSSLTSQQALKLISTLNELQIKPLNHRATLASAVQIIKRDFHELSHKDIRQLFYLIRKYPDISYSCPWLFSLLSHEAKRNNWELPLLSELLGIYNKHRFISMEVLDLVAQKMSMEPEEVANNKFVSVMNFVAAFSLADYQPGLFLNTVLTSSKKLAEMKEQAPQVFTMLVGNLAILDAAPPEMVQDVCCEEFVTRVYGAEKIKGRNKILMFHLNILNQYAQLCLENYNGKTLTKHFVEEAMRAREEYKMPTADESLQKFLEIGLGGSRFVLNGLWTRMGHFIDHVIVMRKGDFPVAINKVFEEENDTDLQYPESENGFCYIEDLVIPSDARVLAVLVARKDWMANDPPKPTGWANFQQRTLAKMGYNTIIIQPKVIYNLLDHEKVPYIMREINQVLRQATATSQRV